jgi:hypothetical protein
MLYSLEEEDFQTKHWPTTTNMVSLRLANLFVVGRLESSSLQLERLLKDVYSMCSRLLYSSSRLEELGVDCPQLLQAPDLILGGRRARQRKAFLHQVRGCPSELLGLGAVQIRVIYMQHRLALASSERFTRALTDEIAVLILRHARLPHRLLIHGRLRLADERHLGVVAERQPVEEVVNAQQPHDPLPVGDVGVGEEPQRDLALVDVLDEPAQLRVGLDDVLQRQRVVDLGVVVQGVDLVVADEPLDGEAVVGVVLLVQLDGVIPLEFEMGREVLVDQLGHEIVDLGAWTVSMSMSKGET